MAVKHNFKFPDTDFYMTVGILNILFMEEYNGKSTIYKNKYIK